MKQILQNYKTGVIEVADVPIPLIRAGGVLVKTHYSLISAGTERATIEVSRKGYLGKARQKPEQVKQVLQTVKKIGLVKTVELVMNKLNSPVPLGYSSSGQIIELGVETHDFQIGDRVACAGGGYASHAEVVFVPKNLCVQIPDKVSYEDASYTTLGAIALQGVRQADARIGENVAVVGLGLIGLLTVQILKAAGCTVVGFDINAEALSAAKKNKVDHAVNLASEDYKASVDAYADKEGFDTVIITASTQSNQPVDLAGELCRKKGKVVVVGDVRLKIPRASYYKKELDFKLSCSYGPGRYDPNYEEYGFDYPFGYVRWTEKRNMGAFLKLIAEDKINLEHITTHRFNIEQAHEAYDLITQKNEQRFIGVLLEYCQDKPIEHTIQMFPGKPNLSGNIKIGLIGAGSFAHSTLLPILKNHASVSLEGVVAAEGFASRDTAKKFGARTCYSNPKDLLENQEVNTLMILTRHNLHGHFVKQALMHNKNVYVEKPLTMTEPELKEVIAVQKDKKRDVFVGYNRRFSPSILEAVDFFSGRVSPMYILYRVNAGYIPKESWIQSPVEGGGRIIGEVCHFIDLCYFVCKSEYKSIFAQNISPDVQRDNVSVNIKFKDGSLAVVLYISCGDSSYPKERIEMFSENSVAVIDDFKRFDFIKNGRKKTKKMAQDKGHKNQLESWLQSLESGASLPVPFHESVNTSIATFMVHESLDKEKVIYFDEYCQRFFE